MGNRGIALATAFACFAAGLGCGGGQTGQPGGGDELDCPESRPLNSELGACCRAVQPDEPTGGTTARERLALYETRDVPLFWRAIPESPENQLGLEPEEALETRLSVRLELDEDATIQDCEPLVVIPVVATLSTDDGFALELQAELNVGAQGVAMQPAAQYFDVAELPSEMLSLCSPRFFFWDDSVVGAFCDRERGRAVFPTACGGIAQVSLEETPFPPLQAPNEAFVPFEAVTLSFEDLPPITLSGTLDDPSACYLDPQTYYVEADLSFETDGVKVVVEDQLGYGQAESESTGPSGRVFRYELPEHCADVSASTEWSQVASDLDVAPELCVAVGLNKLSDGTTQYWAEVHFADVDGWRFASP